MLIVGLGHKGRNGKDTFAAAVQSKFGDRMNIRLASFADPLREEIMAAARHLWDEIAGDAVFNPQEALKMLCSAHHVPFDPDAPVDADNPWGKQRKLQQYWGTEYRRAQDPEYWTKKANEVVETAKRDGADALIFRDLRFYNEFNLVGELGGTRIKVSRLGYVSTVPQHVSETELDDAVFDLHLGVRDGELQLLKDLSVMMFARLAKLKVVARFDYN